VRPTKRESEISPFYSHLPPREIYIYDQEEDTDAPFHAAVTPARDNLTTKTTDITEPDIPQPPRMMDIDKKKFTFESVVLSPCSVNDGRDAEEDGVKENKAKGSPIEDPLLMRDTTEVKCAATGETPVVVVSLLDEEEELKKGETPPSSCSALSDKAPSDEELSTTTPTETSPRPLTGVLEAQVEQTETERATPSPLGDICEAKDPKKISPEHAQDAKPSIVVCKSELEKDLDRTYAVEGVSSLLDIDTIASVPSIVTAPSDELENRTSGTSPRYRGMSVIEENECAPFTDVCMQLKSFLNC
jgi:hypothetical protein